MSLTLGDRIDCVNPINWGCYLNRGLIGDYTYVPGLYDESTVFRGGGIASYLKFSICYDLSRLPGGFGVCRSPTEDQVYGQHGSFQDQTYLDFTYRPGTIGRVFNIGTGGGVAFGGLNSSTGQAGAGGYNQRYIFGKTQQWSGFAWVRSTNLTASRTILSNTNAPTKPGWTLQMITDGATHASLAFWITDNTNGRKVSTPLVTGAGVYAINTWYHVGFTYDGSNTAAGITLYTNGAAVSMQTDLDTNLTGDCDSDDAGIGWGAGGWPGQADQVRIYNRVLAPLEVNQLYRESYAGSPSLYNRVTVPVLAPTSPVSIGATTATYALSGIVARLLAGRVVHGTAQTYTLTGIPAALKPLHIVVDTGAFTLTGKDAVLLITSPARLVAVTSNYSLSGKAPNLLWKRRLVASLRTYSWAGVSATLSKGHPLLAVTRAYALTGIAAGLKATRLLHAATTSYQLTGKAAALVRGYKVIVSVGTYLESGQAAILRRGLSLSASQGVYTLVGIDSSLRWAHSLPATTQSYVETGKDAGLLHSEVLAASPGSFTYTPKPAALDVGRALIAATGTYVVTGLAGLRATRRLPASVGAYTETCLDALLTKTYTPLVASPSSFALDGVGASLRRTAILPASSVAFALSAPSVLLDVGRAVIAAPRSYTLTGLAAGLVPFEFIVAAPASYLLAGKQVGLAPGNQHGHHLQGKISLQPRLHASIALSSRLKASIRLMPRLRATIAAGNRVHA